MPTHLMLRRATTSSRIAVAAGDISGAMASATAAVDAATAAGSGSLKAAAFYARGVVYVAIADFEAAERDIALSVAEAHGAHDPLRALRARLLRAEVERRRGRIGSAIAQLERLRRAAATATPLLRARWQLTSALCARADTATTAIVERQVAATGLGGLARFTPPRANRTARRQRVAIRFSIRWCRFFACARRRTTRRGAEGGLCPRAPAPARGGGGVVAIREATFAHLAADGARIDTDIATRAARRRRHDRAPSPGRSVEAAAPVPTAARRSRAICARWTLGSTYDTLACRCRP